MVSDCGFVHTDTEHAWEICQVRVENQCDVCNRLAFPNKQNTLEKSNNKTIERILHEYGSITVPRE